VSDDRRSTHTARTAYDEQDAAYASAYIYVMLMYTAQQVLYLRCGGLELGGQAGRLVGQAGAEHRRRLADARFNSRLAARASQRGDGHGFGHWTFRAARGFVASRS